MRARRAADSRSAASIFAGSSSNSRFSRNERRVFVSARTGEGIDELLVRIAEVLPAPEIEVTLLVPYDRGEVISRLHVQGRVLSTDYREDGTIVTALVHPARLADLEPFRV